MPNQAEKQRINPWVTAVDLIEKKTTAEKTPTNIQELSVSELLQSLESEGTQRELLRRFNSEAIRISNALKEKGISVRKNADLDGFRTLLSNIKTLRTEILYIKGAGGAYTAEQAETIFKVTNRIDGHHTRVIKDIEEKYPTLFDAAPKKDVPVASTKGDATIREHIDARREELLKKVADHTNTFATTGSATGTLGGGSSIIKEEVVPTTASEIPSAVEKKVEEKKTFSVPETIGEVQNTLKTVRDNMLAAQTKGSPSALISNASYLEFASLLAATEKTIDDSKGHGMYGERIDPELAATLPATFEKLSKLTDDIVSFLETKPVSPEPTLNQAPVAAPISPEPPKNTTLSGDTEKMLAQSKAFREQFRGIKDKNKEGQWYVKEKGKLGEALGAFYTRGLFARIGSGARALVGINAPGLSPELKAQKGAALEAAAAYSASIQKRYEQRLGRELQAGRIDLVTFNIRATQFRSMTANRFVLQPMNMVHDAERKALSDVGGGVMGKVTEWYKSLPLAGKIAVGTAVTATTGVFAGAAAAAIGARAGFKAIMLATGWGALIGKATSKFVVRGAQENVRDTIMDIGATYKPQNMQAAQAEYLDSLRALDRRKTVAVGASMAVAAGVAGGGTLLSEHLADSVSGVDAHLDHTAAVQQSSPDAARDAVAPKIQEAAPETHLDKVTPSPVPAVPHIEVAPNAGHLYYPVTEGDTLWDHLEKSLGEKLRANFIAGHDRDLVLMETREDLIQNPDFTREIGISSGHPDKLQYPHTADDGTIIKGDMVDDTKLEKLVDEKIAKLIAKIGGPMTQAHAGDPTPFDAAANARDGEAADQEYTDDQPSTPASAAPFPPVPGSQGPEVNPTVPNPIPEPIASGPRYEFPTMTTPTFSKPDLDSSGAPEIAASAALGAGVLSALDNTRRVGRTPEKREIQDRKADLIRMIEKTKPTSRAGGIFGSFFSDDTLPSSPYEVLKNMSVMTVVDSFIKKPNETEIARADREVRKANFVRQNRISADVFEHWMDNFALWKSIIVGSDKKLADTTTFDTLLEKISEYQLERGETPKG